MGACCVYPDEYRPRLPKSTPLFRLLDTHYEEFRNVYNERFSKRYGFWRPLIDEVVTKYRQCGDFHYGFARIRCEECGAEYLRPFSCKCRGFCPSCSKRKSLDHAIFLEEELFSPVTHRHWVWSIPKMLRLHFLHHRKLLPMLCRCAWDALIMFLHEALDRRDVFPGGILVPQTFGGMANWNPHVHALITDACWDREGNCSAIPEMNTADIQRIEKLFAGLVFRMLLEEDMISKELVANIPRKGAKQVIYYGAYSQAWRGRERRQGILPKAPTEEKASMKDRSSFSRHRRQLWAVLLKKAWDVDALRCPKCGGRMKVISMIEQPSVIMRILKHLDLWEDPRPPPQPLELVCEPCADYVPWQDDVPEIEVG